MAERVDQARRVLPFFRPHLGKLALVLAATVSTALAEGGQAYLLKPLLNQVLLRGDDDAEDAGDARFLERHKDEHRAATARARGVARERAADPAPLDSQAAALTPFSGRAGLPGWAGDRLGELLDRTRRGLVDAAHSLVEDEAGPDPRARLALALAYQREAERVALATVGAGAAPAAEARTVAAALSLEARGLGRDASYAAASATLRGIFVWALALALVLGVSRFTTAALSGEVVARVYQELQRAVVSRVLTLSLGQLQDTRRGDLLSRLTGDLARTVNGVLLPLVDVVCLQPVRILALYCVALYVSVRLSLCLLVLAAIVMWPIRWWGKFIRRSARARQSALAEVLEGMYQMLAGIRIVKVFRREAFERDRFRRATGRAYDAELAVIRARTGSRTWIHLVNDVSFPFVFLVGGVVVVSHVWDLDAGRFATFAGLIVLMYRPTKTLVMAYNTLQDSLPSMVRALEVLDMTPRLVDAPGATPLEGFTRELAFEGVSYSYDGETEVLRDVSFTAKVGTTTAFVGATGSGKSTLMDLVARFIDPTKGRVLIDGRPLRDVTVASWQGRLALVSQDTFLFNDTIRENIRYGRLDATDEEVEEAARRAQLHDEVVQKPEGYDFVVGERGSNLSGGQVQRVTIARAILRRPEVLLLDEATSALDAQKERLVQAALQDFERDRTTFVIAHRLSTVRHADQILVLHEGLVLERGTHDELIAKGGAYAGLVKHMIDPDHQS
jgi:subfamily B ATP-binding cassette protein MsbA